MSLYSVPFQGGPSSYLFPRSPCWVCTKSFQLCLTLCNPEGCTLPCSSVQGIFQARILKWVAMPSSRESSWPRDWIQLLLFFLHWQADCLPLAPTGKPIDLLITTILFLPSPWPTGQLVNLYQGTSLVVLWLRLQAPDAGALGSIPRLGARSHMLLHSQEFTCHG